MTKAIAIAVPAVLVLVVLVWLGSRFLATPAAPESFGPSAAPPPAHAPGGATTGEREPVAVERAPAGSEDPGQVFALSPELAGLEPPLDFARRRTAQEGAGDPEPTVWRWSDTFTSGLTRAGDLELAFVFPAANSTGPSVDIPWRVRVWGASPGRTPQFLRELGFDGTSQATVPISERELAEHQQVYVLRAAWRAEPPRFLAAAARAGFELERRVIACPEEATEPCRIGSWWGLGSNGAFVHRMLEIDPERPLVVEARYASLFDPRVD